jgi:hypothetical protein
LPTQIDPPLTLTTGSATTETDETAAEADTQPSEEVPVTEYDELDVGETVVELPVIVYTDAPEGTIVNAVPAQNVPLLTVIVGKLFIGTLIE